MALILRSSHSALYILNTNTVNYDKSYCLHFTKEETEARKLSVLLPSLPPLPFPPLPFPSLFTAPVWATAGQLLKLGQTDRIRSTQSSEWCSRWEDPVVGQAQRTSVSPKQRTLGQISISFRRKEKHSRSPSSHCFLNVNLRERSWWRWLKA